MLVLSRKYQEQIVIGDEIVVTVVRVKGQYVKIGIDAPRHMPVLRRELIEREGRGDESSGPDS